MFIAHLPAGYIVGKTLSKRLETSYVVLTASVFGVLPDLDLIWFYLVDDRAFNHHLYWVHLPVFWVVVFAAAYGVLRLLRPVEYWFWRNLLVAATASICVHLVLDSYVGGIAWLYPYSEQLFVLLTLEARYDWWVWNFLWHWSFLVELVIVGWAGYLYVAEKQTLYIDDTVA